MTLAGFVEQCRRALGRQVDAVVATSSLRREVEHLARELEEVRSELAGHRAASEGPGAHRPPAGDPPLVMRVAGLEGGLDALESRMVRIERRSTAAEVAIASLASATGGSNEPGGPLSHADHEPAG